VRPKSSNPFRASRNSHLQRGGKSGDINSSFKKSLSKNEQIENCFPNSINRLTIEKNEKVFCKPVSFKYGAKFKNKSEEKRFVKISQSILNLRHLLINDSSSSHEYIFKFLKEYFSLVEISKFTDD
jgi:hypothetical protein